MKYRTKVQIAEAYRIPPDNTDTRQLPSKWFITGLLDRTLVAQRDGSITAFREDVGAFNVKEGQWLIYSAQGQYSYLPNDEFERCYEPCTAPPAAQSPN